MSKIECPKETKSKSQRRRASKNETKLSLKVPKLLIELPNVEHAKLANPLGKQENFFLIMFPTKKNR